MPSPPAPSAPSASSEQDRALIARALGGDQSAYERLVQKYRQPLWHHLARIVRQREDLDDLVQETFIKAFGALDSYTPQFAFSTWLYKIATNHAIDHLRRRRVPTTSLDRPVQTKDGEMQMELPDETWRPDRPLVEDQRRTLLADAVAALPDKYRRVIEMRHQQDMAYEDIADALGLPLGTVKAHIFRARELLNRALRDRRESI